MRATNRQGRKTTAARGIAAGLLMLAGITATQAAEIRVAPDGNTLLTLAKAPATVIIGNPVYADATILDDKVLIQGRNLGRTNIRILDDEGKMLANLDVMVSRAAEEEVRVYKKGARYTYLCIPECSRVLTAGDSDSRNVAKRLLTTIETARKAAGN